LSFDFFLPQTLKKTSCKKKTLEFDSPSLFNHGENLNEENKSTKFEKDKKRAMNFSDLSFQ